MVLSPVKAAFLIVRSTSHNIHIEGEKFRNNDIENNCAPDTIEPDCIASQASDSAFKKQDNRLFPHYPLYCEGLEKPVFRGISHLVCSLLLPFGLWHLIREANSSMTAEICATVYIITNIWCYGCSALYHVGRWSVQTEILLQKLDHCGIAALSTGTMVPLCILLLPKPVGYVFLSISTSLSLWTMWNIFQLSPSNCRQIMVAGVILPFLPFCYSVMNYIEWRGCMSTIVLQIIGTSVFINHYFNFSPKYFGYHEVFHVCIILAGICVYITNYSIIRRTCNPYANNIDVIDVMLMYFASAD